MSQYPTSLQLKIFILCLGLFITPVVIALVSLHNLNPKLECGTLVGTGIMRIQISQEIIARIEIKCPPSTGT